VRACGNRKAVQLHEGLKQHQRDLRAMDEHAEMIGALRRRDLRAVEHGLQADLLRFYDEISPLLPVESADAGGGSR
jgi:DNA-binding GntR family transcriptional regulator